MTDLAFFDSLRFFKAEEFSSPDKVSRALLSYLDRARSLSEVPYVITSDFRQGDLLSHGDGDAVDIAAVSSRERFAIVSALMIAPFLEVLPASTVMRVFRSGVHRMGIYPEHIHVDVSVRLPQRVLWYGEYNNG